VGIQRRVASGEPEPARARSGAADGGRSEARALQRAVPRRPADIHDPAERRRHGLPAPSRCQASEGDAGGDAFTSGDHPTSVKSSPAPMTWSRTLSHGYAVFSFVDQILHRISARTGGAQALASRARAVLHTRRGTHLFPRSSCHHARAEGLRWPVFFGTAGVGRHVGGAKRMMRARGYVGRDLSPGQWRSALTGVSVEEARRGRWR